MKLLIPFISGILFTILIISFTGFVFKDYIINRLSPVIDTCSIAISKDFKFLEMQLLRSDLNIIGNNIGLSERQQYDYIRYIDSAATKYKLPLLLLHSIIFVESSYDPSAVHALIIVKGKQTRAIGLTGVVWEYHSDSLINNKIAFSRLELTEPSVNIMASAYIIHNYIISILSKNPNISEDKLFDELIRKYYGSYDNSYKDRMLLRIKETASKHWIKRISKSILLEFNK